MTASSLTQIISEMLELEVGTTIVIILAGVEKSIESLDTEINKI